LGLSIQLAEGSILRYNNDMSNAFFLPTPQVVPHLDKALARPLREVLQDAGVSCRASGVWTERPVLIDREFDGIQKEPGDWGAVRVGVPASSTDQQAARSAAYAMAYAIMDIVARESVRGATWAKISAPKGRPPSGVRPMSSAERQRAYRLRHAD